MIRSFSARWNNIWLGINVGGGFGDDGDGIEGGFCDGEFSGSVNVCVASNSN